MTNFYRDLRYALRQLRKSPGFTFTIIFTLALGIGATAAMFSVLEAVVLRSLPYKDADRIVSIDTRRSENYHQPASWPEYQDMRRLNSTFSVIAGVGQRSGVTLTQGKESIYLQAVQGTDNFFDLYGVQPLLGRTYLPGEDQNGKNNIVVLSYQVWQKFFAGQKSAVGQTIDLDGTPTTVIGVMPASFRVLFDTQNVVYTPLHISAQQIDSRGSHWLPVFGRLKSGATVAQADADMNHVFNEMAQQFPNYDKGRTARVIPIAEALHLNDNGKNDRPELYVLFAAAFAFLLIASTNVAGLLLARGLQREREFAVRVALGANRSQIVSQMLTENLLLGVAGCVCGLALGYLLLTAMQRFLEQAFARGANAHLDLPVVAATFVISMLAASGAGFIPARKAAHANPNDALKSGGNAGTTRGQHQLRAGFVVVQVGLSLVLLLCSGLLLLGLRSMLAVNLGFNPDHLLTLEVDIPTGDYKNKDFVKTLVEPLEARISAIPGVSAVGSNNMLPIQESQTNSDLEIVGKPADSLDRQRLSEVRFVTPGYFSAMQLPILQGHGFTEQDAAKSRPVAIVNDTWINKFLNHDEDPLTQAFANDDSSQPAIAIVGVARSGRQDITRLPSSEVDFPMAQIPESWKAFATRFYLFMRTSVPPASIVPQLRKSLNDVAPNIAFRTPQTMDDVLAESLTTNRMLNWIFGIFAAIAVLLTAIGIYGLLSQEVSSSKRDIGLRMAFGATRSRIAQLILLRIASLIAAGLTAGLVSTLLLTRILTSVLNLHVENNLAAVAAMILLMALIGILAAYIPARRAASVDPMQALRG